MKYLIIFFIFIRAVFYAKGQDMPPVIDNIECTYSGANCPDVPCCFTGYECVFTGLSMYNPAFFELSKVDAKTWKCLSQVNFGDSCQYYEECMHIKNAKCIDLTCQCENHFLSYFPDDQECR